MRTKTIENTWRSQSRWNDAHGKKKLELIKKNPETFVVDPTSLPRRKLDLIEAMPDARNKRILEFGSGRGEISVVLAKLGGIVTGIDIGEDLTKLAREVAAVNDVRCEFTVGSIDKLEFEDSTFDLVVGNAILHHLPKKGIVDSLSEAYRVLKPGCVALFNEPIENNRVFDFLQNLIPVGKPGTPDYRPSILQRAKWAEFIERADDRSLSNRELADAKGSFREVEFRYYGWLIRLGRLFPNAGFKRLLQKLDLLFTHKYSPVKKLSQRVVVIYRK
jgi:ubiquinone/menaquinone biosynthesis C-methylase UbiE